MEKLLPQSIEAEQGVLGSILLDPEAGLEVMDLLQVEDFYRTAHKLIYAAIRSLMERHEPPDFITVCDVLEREHQLEDAGGMDYITSLINCVPTSGNVLYYAQIVAQKAEHRHLIHAAGRIAALAYEEMPGALQAAQRLLLAQERREPSSLRPLAQIMGEVLDDIEEAHKNHTPITGIPTGYHALDAILGGLQPTDLILLAGRPGMGKSALGLCMAYHAACKGKRVALFSMEMGRKQLGQRMISMLTGIPIQRLRNGWISDGEYEQVVWAYGLLTELPISIDDACNAPVFTIRNKLLRHQMEQGEKDDLLVIDYLQLMEEEESDHRHNDNRVQAITHISRGLKKLAMEFDIPVLAMAQLSRAVEQRPVKIPQLSDLRDSGSLEQDADIVMFAYRDDYYAGVDEQGNSKSDRPGIADIIIAKHRNGEQGGVQLRFIGPRTRFYNLDEQVGES